MTDFGFKFLGNVLNIKWEHHGVFRRFALNYEQHKIFEALMKKCNELVPTNDFGLAWIDEDSDPICINSEADILLAIQGMNAQLLRIHSIQKEEAPRPPAKGTAHLGIFCDLCRDNPIVGTRFECVVCADYDLCQKCESTGEHKHHAMLRIVDPKETIVPWGKRLRARKDRCDFLNNVGTQIQQTLANFGVDATIESMEIRPPADTENKDKEKTTEPQQEAPGGNASHRLPVRDLHVTATLHGGLPMAQASQTVPAPVPAVDATLTTLKPISGIDATIESMNVAPPIVTENKDKEKTTEPQQEAPMETQNAHFNKQDNIHSSKGSVVELLEPTQNLSIPSIPFSQAIRPFEAPKPAAPPRMPYALGAPHLAANPQPFQMGATNPPYRFGPFEAPMPQTISLGAAPQRAQGMNTFTFQPPADRASVPGHVPVNAREVRKCVIGGCAHPPVAQSEPLTDTQKRTYEQLVRMGFPESRRAEDAARRYAPDINEAIDYLFNLSLD